MKVFVECQYSTGLVIDSKDLDTFLRITGGHTWQSEGYAREMKVSVYRPLSNVVILTDESFLIATKEEE